MADKHASIYHIEPLSKEEQIVELQDAALGGYLYILRNKNKMSIAAASHATGISKQRIRDLEDNKARIGIKAKEISALAKAYGTPENTLIEMACGLYPFKVH